MAGEVALSQALSYARDLKSAYEVAHARERELSQANDRLQRGYQQSLQYAVDLKKTYRRLQRAIFQSLLGLANALEAKDAYTCGHSARVANLSEQIARRSGLSRQAVETIGQAALLHDLGKIGVPEGILRKPGPLTAAEREIMRRHPITGAQIVAPLEFFDGGAVIVRHHHERLDGSGYPDGLVGAAIPLGARIVAVADTYDALTSGRPYRAASSKAEAIGILRAESGRTLDAASVELLVESVSQCGPAGGAGNLDGTVWHRGDADDSAERPF